LAARLTTLALVLDAQRLADEDIVELAHVLGLSFSPARICDRPNVIYHFYVCGIDHHGNLVAALVSRFLFDLLIESLLEQSSFHVTRIDGSSAHHNPVFGELG